MEIWKCCALTYGKNKAYEKYQFESLEELKSYLYDLPKKENSSFNENYCFSLYAGKNRMVIPEEGTTILIRSKGEIIAKVFCIGYVTNEELASKGIIVDKKYQIAYLFEKKSIKVLKDGINREDLNNIKLWENIRFGIAASNLSVAKDDKEKFEKLFESKNIIQK